MANITNLSCEITFLYDEFALNADARGTTVVQTLEFANFIKGDTGAKVVRIDLIGQDEHGGNIYRQTFDDGNTATFTAPKGKEGATVIGVTFVEELANGDYRYRIVYSDNSSQFFDSPKGQKGDDGKDATINGRKSIEIEQGDNITIQNTRDGIRINATAQPQEQSDWNESDQNSKSYIKNRICYEGYGTILEGEYEFENLSHSEDMPYQKLSLCNHESVELAEGKTYALTVGGTTIDAVAKSFNDEDGQSVVFIGNVNILMTVFGMPMPEYDTGEQYLIFALEESNSLLALVDGMALDTDSAIVKLEGPMIHKIDGKWLPEQVQADWNEDDYKKKSFIHNKPILAAVATSGSLKSLHDYDIAIPYQVEIKEYVTEISRYFQADKSFFEIRFQIIERNRQAIGKLGDEYSFASLNTQNISFIFPSKGVIIYVDNLGRVSYEEIKFNSSWEKVSGKPELATSQNLNDGLAAKQDVITDLATIRSGAAAGATAVQPRAISDMETRTHAADTYVAKESGKGLSSNDYTTAEKSKLAGIETGAQKNPTAVSQLENDAQYTTKTYVDNLFNSITHAEDYEY